MLDSIRATAKYFQKVLENTSNKIGVDPEKIKYLEEKIRVAASYAEDAVESKISQIIDELSWTFGILRHQDLLPVVKNMDTTKKQVMEIINDADQTLEFSGESPIDTSSISYRNLEDDEIVHGLDDDLEIIMKRLTGPPSNLDVVTISGMGGIGKTTLARKAYDHLAIRYHFDILAWVTISQEFRRRNVYIEALRCISKQKEIVKPKDYDEMDDNELAVLLQNSLKGPRYLVVVDDIWSRDVWDSISVIFPDYKNGSRILLTTRETEVAMYANTSSPHEMNLLSLEDGWKLLSRKVFGLKHDQFPELEEIGKEIVGKCQGLPLTISVIGGHLSKIARTLEVWKDVARTLSEIIASNSDKCLGVLGLSYRYLPNRLKPCFLSMSSFPEDFQVETGRLIQLWITEGFIRTSGDGKSLGEVAIDYLEDLISRNLIQARKRRFNGEVKSCGIHDLLREFCLIEAEMTNHMHVERTRPTLPTRKHNVLYRFSFQTSAYSVDDCRKLLPAVARSIYLFSQLNLPLPGIKLVGIFPVYHYDPVIHDFFSRFKLLRVLIIFRKIIKIKSFPLVITKLSHLRYLQIRFQGAIPESISKLQNLQTLICSGEGPDITLPGTIWMMKNLRHISLPEATYLPSPMTIGMPNLEEFLGLSCASCTNEVFSGIPNLRRLTIRLPILLHGTLPYPPLDMSSLSKLEAFKCYFHLSFPLFPTVRFVFPSSLKRLSFRHLPFRWDEMSSTVIMLPNLEELKFKSCEVDRVWTLSDEDKFKSLKLLVLSALFLVRWEASSENFPNLKRLILKNCTELKEIPTDFSEIATLESIELHNCSNSVQDSAREIQQEQEDMGNNPVTVYIDNSRRI